MITFFRSMCKIFSDLEKYTIILLQNTRELGHFSKQLYKYNKHGGIKYNTTSRRPNKIIHIC